MTEIAGRALEHQSHSRKVSAGFLAPLHCERKSQCQGAERKTQCQGCEAATMPWDGMLVVQPDGTVEESWEFETDTYTIGLLAMTRVGLPQGAFELFLALVTPIVQLLAFFRIFQYLLTTTSREPGEEQQEEDFNTTVQVICFLLMALQVSNEALEGLHKLVFSFRAFGGTYKDVMSTAGIGIFLGFSQCMVAVATVGLSMLVVSLQQTALDAFMNFVAVAFLTEVDNVLVGARTVKGLVTIDTAITVQHKLKAEVGQASSHHWQTKALVVVNILVIASLFVVLQAQYVLVGIEQAEAEEAKREREEAHEEGLSFDLSRQMMLVFLLLLVLNSAMYIGNRLGAGVCFFMCLGYACLLLGGVDMVYLYSTHRRLLPVMASQALQAFALVGPTCAGAMLFNPFPFVMCPLKSPSLVWATLVHAVFCFESVHRFGAKSFSHSML